MPGEGNRYSPEFKDEFVREYIRRNKLKRSDKNFDRSIATSVKGMAQEYGIAYTTARFWISGERPVRKPYVQSTEQKKRAIERAESSYDRIVLRLPKDASKDRLKATSVSYGL